MHAFSKLIFPPVELFQMDRLFTLVTDFIILALVVYLTTTVCIVTGHYWVVPVALLNLNFRPVRHIIL
jgi:hypothetical protein